MANPVVLCSLVLATLCSGSGNATNITQVANLVTTTSVGFLPRLPNAKQTSQDMNSNVTEQQALVLMSPEQEFAVAMVPSLRYDVMQRRLPICGGICVGGIGALLAGTVSYFYGVQQGTNIGKQLAPIKTEVIYQLQHIGHLSDDMAVAVGGFLTAAKFAALALGGLAVVAMFAIAFKVMESDGSFNDQVGRLGMPIVVGVVNTLEMAVVIESFSTVAGNFFGGPGVGETLLPGEIAIWRLYTRWTGVGMNVVFHIKDCVNTKISLAVARYRTGNFWTGCDKMRGKTVIGSDPKPAQDGLCKLDAGMRKKNEYEFAVDLMEVDALKKGQWDCPA